MVDHAVSYLIDNPILALLLGLLAISLLLSLAKKLFKIALVIAIVLAIAGGSVLHFANQQVKEHGKVLIDKGTELIEDGARTVEKHVKEKLAGGNTDDSTGTPTKKESKKPSH
ncbi:MAG: hypothetical protein HY962_00590 [Ignavibacteriae bacterium]|nr:hypothetical protein [Ignavibacteriota bacterium]